MTVAAADGGGEMKAAVVEEDIIGWFEEAAENAEQTQRETLRRILETNQTTEYLRRWLGGDFNAGEVEPADLESVYISAVPLSSHSDIEPYIQKIADGESSVVLTADPITTLSLSSGTTDGRPKYIPFTRFSAQSTLQIFKIAAAYRSRVYPIRAGGRVLEFIYSSKQFRTSGGLTVGTATTHYFASEEFKAKQRSSRTSTISPPEVIAAGDYKQSTYCHLLLGLVYAGDVEVISSTFAYSVVQALSSLEDLWPELCDDIRHGCLSHSRVTSPEVRKAVLALLSPDPPLATALELRCSELRRANWRGILRALWPKAKYVYSIMTGSMQPYMQKLRHYAGGMPLVCADYGSTESWIGVNVDPSAPPETAIFTVVPTFAYFEFIPLYRRHDYTTATITDNDDEIAALCACHDFVEGRPLPLSKVKIGQQYELVLTTFTGLYRYRLGDVVEVAGFYKGTPQLSLVCRRKLILALNIDKNTERDLQLAVEKGSRVLGRTGAELVDFTSHAEMGMANRGASAGHYVVYWEILGDAEDDVLSECCSEMDAAFVDYGYVVSRKTSSIGPLELKVVEQGTFCRILDYYIANGLAMSQFKIPRCTRNPALLAILDTCTVKQFWSTAYA